MFNEKNLKQKISCRCPFKLFNLISFSLQIREGYVLYSNIRLIYTWRPAWTAVSAVYPLLSSWSATGYHPPQPSPFLGQGSPENCPFLGRGWPANCPFWGQDWQENCPCPRPCSQDNCPCLGQRKLGLLPFPESGAGPCPVLGFPETWTRSGPFLQKNL